LTWLWVFLSLAALYAAATWWGSDVLFHPPKMLPNTVWPDQFGLAFEKVTFRSGDGLSLAGWLIGAQTPTSRTLFMCHGWGDNKGDLLKRVHPLARDFNLFFFDFRSHGESEGKRTTLGCQEARDFDAALEFLKRARPEWTKRMGLFGLSMGASMSVRGMAEHPDFRCAVFESPFVSFGRVAAQFAWNNFRLPAFPFAFFTVKTVGWRIGEDPDASSPILFAPRLPPKPSLFIAGELDRLMPPSEVRFLFESAAGPKEYWLVPGAEHGKCWEAGGEGYQRRLKEFFDKNT
jgi:pimeloyl-ACP methyl ester carboxylesterase